MRDKSTSMKSIGGIKSKIKNGDKIKEIKKIKNQKIKKPQNQKSKIKKSKKSEWGKWEATVVFVENQ